MPLSEEQLEIEAIKARTEHAERAFWREYLNQPLSEEKVRQIVREEVTAALERFYAKRDLGIVTGSALIY